MQRKYVLQYTTTFLRHYFFGATCIICKRDVVNNQNECILPVIYLYIIYAAVLLSVIVHSALSMPGHVHPSLTRFFVLQNSFRIGYSELGRIAEVNLWELLWQNIYRPKALHVAQPTASSHQRRLWPTTTWTSRNLPKNAVKLDP